MERSERPKSILVVEDEEDFGEILRRTLTRKGYRVGFAKNGKEALKALETESYDLIITDLVMPEMGGVGFLKAIRAKGLCIPVIAITAYGDWWIYQEASALRVSAFLQKPFSMAKLVETVKRIFEPKEPL